MQTHEWEALLDGITPAPWKFEEHYETEYPAGVEWGPMLTGLEHHVLAGEKHLFGAYNDYALIEYPGNLRLAAHAPAAVAEVVRLRRAMEALRVFVDGFPLVPPLVGMGSIEGRAREMQSAVSDTITRILEGGNHE